MATGALARAKFRSGNNGRALLVRYSDAEVAVPEAAFQFEGFRAWTLSDRFPQEGRISFIDGEVIVDISQEEITTHALVRTEIVRVLASINVDEEIGLVIGDGARVVHQSAGVSNIPDTVVVSYASLESGRVAMTPRKDEPEQKIELVGAPDLVVEIVSDSSVIKDEKKLRAAYHAAGIPEYWLIDARGEAISFQILSQRRSKRFVTSKFSIEV